MPTFRAAVIGCGRIGSTIDDELDRWCSHAKPYSHAARYAEAPQTKLVAGCDTDEEKAKAFKERWGMKHAYTDIHKMMKAQKPDIVSIATQTATRTEATLAALEHDVKALFLDKPIAETLRDADRILNPCREKGIVVAVNCSRRWEPLAIQAKALLDEGVIGDLRCIVAFCPGGLSHMGSHIIDFMRYYAGDAEWVVGQTAEPPEESPDADVAGLALIQFENDVHGYLNMLDAGAVTVELDLIGAKGRIKGVNNGARWELYLPGTVPTKHTTLAEQQFPIPWPMTTFGIRSVEDICACIESGDKPICNGDDGRAALEIALALRHSQREGNVRVNLPFTDLDAAIHSA